MLVFKDTKENKLILIIGLGLIGSEIASLFEHENKYKIENVIINWKDPNYFKNDFPSYLKHIVAFSPKKIDIIWAAGKAGFGSTYEYCKSENLHFVLFIKLLGENSEINSDKLTIHFISSAGGLFEGQLSINKDSIPSPKRPYGEFKLKQENLLREVFPRATKIYRPSSVYGKISIGKRLGLVSTLIDNSLKNKESVIFGSQDTLRDFISANDIAKAVFKVINYPASYTEDTFYLISGRPSSIFEIIHLIKKITGKNGYTRFVKVSDPFPICFSPKLKEFECDNLELGIIKIIYQTK